MVANSSKHAFWQALLMTIVVFGLGLMAGFFVEGARTDKTQSILLNSEVSLQDETLRERAIGDFNISCELAEKNLFEFADRIYEESRKLEQYDSASKFSDSLIIVHRRYDLLRAMLWTDSRAFTKRCGMQFHTIVYLYDYDPYEVEQRARQAYFSRILTDVKERNGGDLLLIPIAANLNLSSIDVIREHYAIREMPVIVIDEKAIVSDVITLEELETMVFERNKQ